MKKTRVIELNVSLQRGVASLYFFSSAGGDIWQLQHRTLSSNKVIHAYRRQESALVC